MVDPNRTADLLFDWFVPLFLLNYIEIHKFVWIQTSQTGGQPYSDTSPYEVSECSLPKLKSILASMRTFKVMQSHLPPLRCIWDNFHLKLSTWRQVTLLGICRSHFWASTGWQRVPFVGEPHLWTHLHTWRYQILLCTTLAIQKMSGCRPHWRTDIHRYVWGPCCVNKMCGKVNFDNKIQKYLYAQVYKYLQYLCISLQIHHKYIQYLYTQVYKYLQYLYISLQIDKYIQ